MSATLPDLRRRRAAALCALAPLAALAPPAAVAQAAPPQLRDAWARPTVAGQAAGGGFLTIVGGSAADRVLGGSSPAAARVELHTMAMDGDVMRMRELAAIEVPAGRQVELKPGGLHVMLVGLNAPLKAGESFPLTLRFEKAGELTVPVQVRAMAPAPAHKH